MTGYSAGCFLSQFRVRLRTRLPSASASQTNQCGIERTRAKKNPPLDKRSRVRYNEDRMERFWSKVDIRGLYSCWNWTAYLTPKGYGNFSLDGRMEHAHRVAYILIYGEIPEGHDVHHECENKRCVNPLHLQSVTRLEHKAHHPTPHKTHCKRGHERAPENLYSGSGCKKCQSEAKVLRYSKNREAILQEGKEYYREHQEEILVKQKEAYHKRKNNEPLS